MSTGELPWFWKCNLKELNFCVILIVAWVNHKDSSLTPRNHVGKSRTQLLARIIPALRSRNKQMPRTCCLAILASLGASRLVGDDLKQQRKMVPKNEHAGLLSGFSKGMHTGMTTFLQHTQTHLHA